jgi:hypothetical protein
LPANIAGREFAAFKRCPIVATGSIRFWRLGRIAFYFLTVTQDQQLRQDSARFVIYHPIHAFDGQVGAGGSVSRHWVGRGNIADKTNQIENALTMMLRKFWSCITYGLPTSFPGPQMRHGSCSPDGSEFTGSAAGFSVFGAATGAATGASVSSAGAGASASVQPHKVATMVGRNPQLVGSIIPFMPTSDNALQDISLWSAGLTKMASLKTTSKSARNDVS